MIIFYYFSLTLELQDVFTDISTPDTSDDEGADAEVIISTYVHTYIMYIST
jgi:hypothetical protein